MSYATFVVDIHASFVTGDSDCPTTYTKGFFNLDVAISKTHQGVAVQLIVRKDCLDHHAFRELLKVNQRPINARTLTVFGEVVIYPQQGSLFTHIVHICATGQIADGALVPQPFEQIERPRHEERQWVLTTGNYTTSVVDMFVKSPEILRFVVICCKSVSAPGIYLLRQLHALINRLASRESCDEIDTQLSASSRGFLSASRRQSLIEVRDHDLLPARPQEAECTIEIKDCMTNLTRYRVLGTRPAEHVLTQSLCLVRRGHVCCLCLKRERGFSAAQ